MSHWVVYRRRKTQDQSIQTPIFDHFGLKNGHFDLLILAESHVMKAFIYPSSGEVLAIETEYVYSDSGKDITWRYHVAPVILVITEDSGGIWMVIDPSVMDEPATLLEWREEMGDPGAWFDLQDFDKYWPTTMYPSEGSEVDYETIPEARELGSLFVDQYLNQCRSQGYCR